MMQQLLCIAFALLSAFWAGVIMLPGLYAIVSIWVHATQVEPSAGSYASLAILAMPTRAFYSKHYRKRQTEPGTQLPETDQKDPWRTRRAQGRLRGTTGRNQERLKKKETKTNDSSAVLTRGTRGRDDSSATPKSEIS